VPTGFRKLARALVAEVRGICAFLIMEWPNTPVGIKARGIYWRRRTGVRRLVVGRGADLGDCSLLKLGENVEIGERVEFVLDEPPIGFPVYIGSNITMARGVYLRSGNHRFDDLSRPIMAQGHSSKQIEYQGATYSVVLEGDNWIGANVIILSGAFIGRGCVIGAGAVVTGVIPPYSVAAGVPARVLSRRDESRSIPEMSAS
jgi:acetyltransferase-like isoleucine patch superfamily enzyme